MRISRQIVRQFHPGKLLHVINVELRDNLRRVFQARRIEMDFVRVTVGIIGDRRPAIGTEQAAHARRRVIDSRLPPRETRGAAWHADECRKGRRAIPPAALAMAIPAPVLRPVIFEPGLAAKAAPFRSGYRALRLFRLQGSYPKLEGASCPYSAKAGESRQGWLIRYCVTGSPRRQADLSSCNVRSKPHKGRSFREPLTSGFDPKRPFAIEN